MEEARERALQDWQDYDNAVNRYYSVHLSEDGQYRRNLDNQPYDAPLSLETRGKMFLNMYGLAGVSTSPVNVVAKVTATPITKNSIVEGLKISNHAWRKSGLGRGATEEMISKVIKGAEKTGTIVTDAGKGKFSGSVIKVYNHSGIKVAVDETRQIIMSIRPEKGFKLP